MSNLNIIKSVITGQEVKAFDFSKAPKTNSQKPAASEAVDTYSSVSQNQQTSSKFHSLLEGKCRTSSK